MEKTQLQKIEEYVTQSPGCNRHQIATDLKIPKSTLDTCLRKLVSSNKVTYREQSVKLNAHGETVNKSVRCYYSS